MEYINRKGHRYFVFEGKTKTGKPKYFASRRTTSDKAVRVDKLPSGFEIAEHPSTAAVSVRRAKPTRILPHEATLVEQLAAEASIYSSIKTDVRGDQIIIYTPDRDPGHVDKMLSSLLGDSIDSRGMAEWTATNTHYTAVLRLTLQDEKDRIYTAERYCFRGSIDGWIPLANQGTLETLSEELFSHLGQDSFYDLM
jgi:hypothetical protein